MPRALKLSIAALLILAFLIFWHSYQKSRSERLLAERLQAIRTQGFPINAAEWNTWYPEPPASNNAALIYNQMIPLPLTNHWFDQGSKTNIFYFTNAIPAQIRAELADLIATNKSALQLLHDAGKLPASRYPINLTAGPNTSISHLSSLRNAARLLKAEALDHTLSDRPQAAIDSMITALRTGHSLSNEPVLISFLVQCACYKESAIALENILNRASFSPALFPPLSEELWRAENSLNLTRALAGERASGICSFQDISTLLTYGRQPTMGESTMFSLYEASGLLESDFQTYLEFMNNYVAASQKPPEQIVSLFKTEESKLEKKIGEGRWKMLLSGMLLPALTKTAQRKVEAVAQLRLARLALTILTYQSQHNGQFPSALTKLTDVPLDPFDGKLLRYRQTETGFLIWSIGADRIDQGGTPKTKGSNRDDYDIIFTFEKSAVP